MCSQAYLLLCRWLKFDDILSLSSHLVILLGIHFYSVLWLRVHVCFLRVGRWRHSTRLEGLLSARKQNLTRNQTYLLCFVSLSIDNVLVGRLSWHTHLWRQWTGLAGHLSAREPHLS